MELKHLSFNGKLEGVWHPRLPDGHDVIGGKLTEANIKRICCSPTITKCFQAIYPNISKFFEVNNYPYMEFYVYSPVLKDNSSIIYPEELTNKRLVWDAHVTHEHGLLNPTFMKLVGKVRILNTKNQEDLYTHPYNDPTIKKIYVAPAKIDYKYK